MGLEKRHSVRKLLGDWSNGTQFQEFNMVLVIHLRDVDKNQTVGNIVKAYLSDSNKVTSKQIDKYILANPEKVFIVFDGLDEFHGDVSNPSGSPIAEILRSTLFKSCKVLVTTRPWKCYQVRLDRHVNMEYAFIAIEGFSGDNLLKIHRQIFHR